MNLPQDVHDRIADIHNSLRGHVGLKLCKRRFKMIRKQRIKDGLPPEDAIPDRMINEFLRQCPYCQITNRLRLPLKAFRFTCASYNLFEVLHLDHIVDHWPKMSMVMSIYLLSLMPSPDGWSCSPPSQRRSCSIILVAPKSFIPTKNLHFIMS